MGTAAAAATARLNTTLDNYRGQLVDNVFNKHVMSWILMEKQRTRMLGGGEKITEHLLISGNDDVGNLAEWGEFVITPQGGITTASFDWKQIITSIAISGMEELKNNGEEAILNLFQARVKQSETSLQKLVNDQLLGVAAGGWTSIYDIIDDAVTVGGLTVAAQPLWKARVQNAIAATSGVAAGQQTFANLQKYLTNLYNTASDGNDVVTCLLGTQAIFEMYELGLTPNMRFQAKDSTGSIGFTNLLFKGVPFYWDKAAQTGTVVGINADSLTLVGHKDRWFKQSAFTDSPIDSVAGGAGNARFVDARYAVITAVGNLTVNDRRKNFKLKNFNM
jgi:hypothetical protein